MPDLELELRALSSWVDWPEPAVDLPERIAASLPPRPANDPFRSPFAAGPFVAARRPWVAAAAAALVALLTIGAVVPGARHAVADWLGIAAVRITIGDDPPPTPDTPTLGLGRRTPVPTDHVPGALGTPDEAFRRGDEVSLVWLLAAGGDVVLTTFPSSERSLLTKEVDIATDVRLVSVDGAEAWWIDGSHVVRRGDERALARRVLLWEADGLVHRLESDLELDDALRIAESL